MVRKKIIIGITMGDPAGIGPEIIVRYFQENNPHSGYDILIIGDRSILDEIAKRINVYPSSNFHSISSLSEVRFDEGLINVLDLKNIRMEQVKIGRATDVCGKASVEYIKKAIDLCKKGDLQAMVTAPINKEAMNLAGFHYAGHTEILAQSTNTHNYSMMLAGGSLRVVLVTTHAAICDVSFKITQDRVYRTICLTYQWLAKFYPQKTNIAVCGLNPHAGENGLFGREELDCISPAIAKAQSENIPVEGPYPSDTLFYQAQNGIFGAVVVMYHDQGLIPLKMLAFDTGVNITLGLPIIRTSVDHGTAYDIAWQGRAKISSLTAALETAAHLAQRNQEE